MGKVFDIGSECLSLSLDFVLGQRLGSWKILDAEVGLVFPGAENDGEKIDLDEETLSISTLGGIEAKCQESSLSSSL